MGSSLVYFLIVVTIILGVIALNLWQIIQDIETKLLKKSENSLDDDSTSEIGSNERQNVPQKVNIGSILEKRWNLPPAVAKEIRM